MARYHFDENVNYDIAVVLVALGHDVVTSRDLRMDGQDDDLHLLAAANDKRILVTHNGRDFVVLNPAWRHWSRAWHAPVEHAGILIVPQAPHPSPDLAARELDAIPSRVSLANECWSYEWRTLHDWEHRPVL